MFKTKCKGLGREDFFRLLMRFIVPSASVDIDAFLNPSFLHLGDVLTLLRMEEANVTAIVKFLFLLFFLFLGIKPDSEQLFFPLCPLFLRL